jgi:hypothetical protein
MSLSASNTICPGPTKADRLGDALGMDGRCRPRVRVGRKLDAEGRVSLLVDYGTATHFNPAVTLPEGFTVVTRDLAIFDSIARVGINYKFGAPVASPGY